MDALRGVPDRASAILQRGLQAAGTSTLGRALYKIRIGHARELVGGRLRFD